MEQHSIGHCSVIFVAKKLLVSFGQQKLKFLNFSETDSTLPLAHCKNFDVHFLQTYLQHSFVFYLGALVASKMTGVEMFGS